MLFFAGCILLTVQVLVNITFQFFYAYTFNRQIAPADKVRKYKEGIIERPQLDKFIEPSDPEFVRYSKKHECWSWTVAFFTFLCTFKCNKSYYSHFYSFSMFKAKWTHGKYYRKSMTCFGILSMIIDGLIICVCVAALLTMEVFSNMLWITTVEVAVLSLLLIIFGCIELFLLKKYLAYTEETDPSMKRINVASANDDFLDKESREVMMKNLLRNVKTN